MFATKRKYLLNIQHIDTLHPVTELGALREDLISPEKEGFGVND